MKRKAKSLIAPNDNASVEKSSTSRVSKKEQFLSLYNSGIDNIEDIALMTNSRTTYVASVLQSAGLINGYFDLYTTSSLPMNAYSRFFAGKLSFKNEEAARKSVELINRTYRQFSIAQDRAGQHHALMMGLTMFNRARWTGKKFEADIFRQWLLVQLSEYKIVPTVEEQTTTIESNEDNQLSLTGERSMAKNSNSNQAPPEDDFAPTHGRSPEVIKEMIQSRRATDKVPDPEDIEAGREEESKKKK